MIKKLLFFIVMMITVFELKAQNSKPIILSNIKIELANMLYGDYSMAFERKMANTSSLSLRLGYLQPLNHLFKKYDVNLTGSKTGYDCSLEYRFFLIGKNKSELLGFYIAPYIRYASLNLDFIDEIQITPFSVALKYSNIGGGLQLGFQKKLGNGNGAKFLEQIIYDFHLIGGGIDQHSLSLYYQEIKNPEEYDYGQIEDDIKGYFDKYPILNKKLKFGYLNSKLGVTLPFVLPGLRAGFSLGYRF